MRHRSGKNIDKEYTLRIMIQMFDHEHSGFASENQGKILIKTRFFLRNRKYSSGIIIQHSGHFNIEKKILCGFWVEKF